MTSDDMTSDDDLLRTLLTAGPDSEPQTDRILDAALRSFETYGPRRTTMDDVARESGLGRATIYRRFPTKGDLVTGVLLREARRFFAELDEAVAALPTLEERLVEGFAVALRISREQRLVNRLMVVEPELILPHSTVKAGPLLAAARGYIAGRLRTAQRLGAAPADVDPEVVAEILVRLTHSLVLTPEGHIPLDEEGARAFARRYLLPIIVRPSPAP
ncbi:TetR/AcrR family transcriptional regulator [Actinomadura bangladeshensis]|uniref:TetR/AcrR family transcriptional regulator n=2 Tax=Actinomadura bangladeshensis TaxID=453573 RepID=A0A6L9QUS0_9ACTN|nr:TetR/AcrR family transcriptional regulator [Actinomadura bangladeshensis]NEA29265.1 TetR/AcrR family transcriptional regulator [Actinomadura bangladeshensis]